MVARENTTFLQKYIFAKKQYFNNRLTCKKAAFLHKKAAFLQKYIFVKKQYFYNQVTCKKAAFLHKNDAFLCNIYIDIYIFCYIYK